MGRPRVVRYRLNDPDVLAHYLRNGVIWEIKLFWPKAIDAIQQGLVPLDECRNVPPEVVPYVTAPRA